MSLSWAPWVWRRYHELALDDLYDLLALRAEVFVLEQGPYLDPDGLDRRSWHLLGRNGQGELMRYLRVVDPGEKYAEPSIGRVVLKKALRGSGAGEELVAEGVRRCVSDWPGRGIRISAQAHLQRFYGRHGFTTQGEPYLEDGIAHAEMWRAP